MLDDYEQTQFSADGKTRTVFMRGSGPAVIVMTEVPGITPQVLRFAGWVVDAGFRVYLPQLFGTPGKPMSVPYALDTLVRACISREFAVLSMHRSGPVADWLRALVRQAHAECGGKGVGAIGMCLTGNFALSMMLEPALMAPVLAQPSLPFPISPRHKAALHVSPVEWQCVRERCAAGDKVLGLRFTHDPYSPSERFETLKRELGDAFEAIEIDERHAHSQAMKPAHSVVTTHLIDRDGEPTREAARQVIEFFQSRLLRH